MRPYCRITEGTLQNDGLEAASPVVWIFLAIIFSSRCDIFQQFITFYVSYQLTDRYGDYQQSHFIFSKHQVKVSYF